MKKISKTIPNILTSIRIILTAIFVLLIKLQFSNLKSEYNISTYVLIVFILICLSDFFDGKIARKIGAESKMGSILDVLADFIYIISSYIIFYHFNIINGWFIILIIAKLLEFIITSKIIIKMKFNFSKVFIFDIIGRITSVIFFILPGIICILFTVLKTDNYIIVQIIELLTLTLSLVSSIYRINKCLRHFCLYKTNKVESEIE